MNVQILRSPLLTIPVQVLVTKYPALETVVDRLLDIYFLLSAGGHHGDEVTMDAGGDGVGKFLSRDGRQISTRYNTPWGCM